MTEHLTDVDQLPNVKLTPEQDARAHDLSVQMNESYIGNYLAARVIVHLQDRIAELERHLNKAEIERAWAIGKLREAGLMYRPAETTSETITAQAPIDWNNLRFRTQDGIDWNRVQPVNLRFRTQDGAQVWPAQPPVVDCLMCGYKIDSIAHFEHCGHGHVTKRHDGMLAKCGGPLICKVCARERDTLTTPEPHTCTNEMCCLYRADAPKGEGA